MIILNICLQRFQNTKMIQTQISWKPCCRGRQHCRSISGNLLKELKNRMVKKVTILICQGTYVLPFTRFQNTKMIQTQISWKPCCRGRQHCRSISGNLLKELKNRMVKKVIILICQGTYVLPFTLFLQVRTILKSIS